MRTSIYGLGLFLSFCLVTSANARTFRSIEKQEDAIGKNRGQYMVIVKVLAPVTDPRVKGEHDSADTVRVEILARDPHARAAFKPVRQPFVTYAFNDDVMYNVQAWKNHGFGMMIYLDEFDQTSAKLKGVRGSIRMDTESDE